MLVMCHLLWREIRDVFEEGALDLLPILLSGELGDGLEVNKLFLRQLNYSCSVSRSLLV